MGEHVAQHSQAPLDLRIVQGILDFSRAGFGVRRLRVVVAQAHLHHREVYQLLPRPALADGLDLLAAAEHGLIEGRLSGTSRSEVSSRSTLPVSAQQGASPRVKNPAMAAAVARRRGVRPRNRLTMGKLLQSAVAVGKIDERVLQQSGPSRSGQHCNATGRAGQSAGAMRVWQDLLAGSRGNRSPSASDGNARHSSYACDLVL